MTDLSEFFDGISRTGDDINRKKTFSEKVKEIDSRLSDEMKEVFDLVRERMNLVFHGGLCGPGFSNDEGLLNGIERIVEIDKRLRELVEKEEDNE